VAERVMFEALRRERSTQATEWEVTMMLMGTFMGVKSDAYMPIIASMKKQLEKRYSGQAFSASFVREALMAKRDEINRDRGLLKRLDSLGHDDKDT
jgi:hypothetical protein